MNKSFIICIALAIALDFSILCGQNTDSALVYKLRYDSLYGMDPQLFNGIKYFPEHSLARGYPFWQDNQPMKADLVYSGRYYKNLKIKYNLYIQEFILEYADQFGGLQQLILNRSNIDSVFINNTLFIRNKYSDIKEYFLQVIHEDKISCYFTWKKEYRFNNTGVEVGHEYSDEMVTSYIVKNGRVYVFANNRSFLKIFPEDSRDSIREYMKDNRINVKKKMQADVKKLCVFCNKPDSE